MIESAITVVGAVENTDQKNRPSERYGREQARKRPDYKDGRPRISKEQIDHALELLKDPMNTYNRVVKLTGISKSTLVRRLREQRAEKRANRK